MIEQKSIPEVANSTAAIYHSHARSLSRSAHKEAGATTWREVAIWFAKQDYSWSKSTIRAYRRSLSFMAEQALSNHALNEFLQILKSGPKAHSKKGETATGRATKRKNITTKEWKRFQREALKSGADWDRFVLDFLKFGLIIPSRPIELGAMLMDGATLWIQTAKANEYRGLTCSVPDSVRQTLLAERVYKPEGEKFRSFELSQLKECDREVICRVSSEIRGWVEQKGGWKKFYQALRDRCRTLSANAIIHPAIAPGTPRHLSLSAIKSKSGSQAAAALAGHASQRSTTNHYKRASKSSLAISPAHQLSPTSDSLALVKSSEKALHPRQRPFVKEHVVTQNPIPAKELDFFSGINFSLPDPPVKPDLESARQASSRKVLSEYQERMDAHQARIDELTSKRNSPTTPPSQDTRNSQNTVDRKEPDDPGYRP